MIQRSFRTPDGQAIPAITAGQMRHTDDIVIAAVEM